MTPRGIKDKNPCNLRFSTGTHFLGEIGQEGGYAIFDTADHGIRAGAVVLLTYARVHGINTIRQAITRWAPPTENDTASYIANVSTWTGYGPDDVLTFTNPNVLAKLLTAIIRQEVSFRYTTAQIAKSCAEALGGQPHAVFALFNQGSQPVTIAVMNKATVPLGVDFDKLIAAMQMYIGLYLYPTWGFRARLVKTNDFIPGAWAMVFIDDADQPGALALHELTPSGLPLMRVFVKTTLQAGDLVSVSATHELAEAGADPGCQLMAARNDVNQLIALENCDPVEAEAFLVNGIPMSDFVYPSYFESFRAANSVKFDHMGKISYPFQILPGGYAIVYQNGAWSQVFGSAEKAMLFAREDRRGHRSEIRKKRVLERTDSDAIKAL
jgi:hypothetical protein